MLIDNALTLALLASPTIPEWIELDVRMPDGSPAAAARILHEEAPIPGMDVVQLETSHLTLPSQLGEKWTSDRPGVGLPDNLVQVWALAGEPEGLDREYISEIIEIDATTQVDQVFTLSLQPRVGLRISLTMDGDPIQGHCLTLPIDEGDTLDLDRLSSEGLHFAISESSRILDADPGRYWVGTSFDVEHPIASHQVVEVTDRVVEVALDLPLSDAPVAFHVDLHLGGERYRGLVALSVWTMRRAVPRLVRWRVLHKRDGSQIIFPDAAGIRLLRAMANGEPGSAATLFARIYGRGGGTSFGIPLDLSRPEILISVDGVAQVEVLVRGGSPDGPELMVAWCPAATIPHTADWLREVRDEFEVPVNDGQASIGPVPSGPADLVLFASKNGRPDYPITKRAVDLSVGQHQIEINLPSLHSVTVHADPKVEKLTLSSLQVGFFSAPVVDGTASFSDLPAGDYNLSASVRGLQLHCNELPLSLPVSGPLQYSPQPFDAMRIILLGPAGPATHLGFEDGDLIVGVDDILFADDPGEVPSLHDSIDRESTFLVQRAGKTVQVTTTLPSPRALRGSIDFRQGSTTAGEALRAVSDRK